jgi:hypothetical protein
MHTDVPETAERIDFFISYTARDVLWAEWIAWWLELAGYSVIIQAWDFRPGHNFVLRMQHAASVAKRTIIVLSPAFLEAVFTQPEWAASFASDPTGAGRHLIPIRVEHCKPDGLLGQLVYVDLVGVADEHEAAMQVLDGVRSGRGKPTVHPAFPGKRLLERLLPPTPLPAQ